MSEIKKFYQCEECGKKVSLIFHIVNEGKWVCYDCKEGLTLEREKEFSQC